MGFLPRGVMMGGAVPGVLLLFFLRCVRGFVFIVAGAVGLVLLLLVEPIGSPSELLAHPLKWLRFPPSVVGE